MRFFHSLPCFVFICCVFSSMLLLSLTICFFLLLLVLRVVLFRVYVSFCPYLVPFFLLSKILRASWKDVFLDLTKKNQAGS
jgi:hypothetical protein